VLLWRAHKGKEVKERLGERVGKATIARSSGKLIWFHAASMGESSSVVPVIKRLLECHPEATVLMTTVTVTSAKNIGEKLPKGAIHQFAPVDTPIAIARFLKHWKPDVAFWVESEFWPNMMEMTHDTGCPMVLLNARVSRRSFRRWQRFRTSIEQLLCLFTMILAKSDEDASRLRNLGADAHKVSVQGNLKFSAPALEADPKLTSEILGQIGGRRIWLAASTHSGEEEIIAGVHNQVKTTYPDLLTVIVPRHSRRGKEIAATIEKMEMRVALRSAKDEISSSTDIYVADTMGELGIFYRLAGIVFIGGSLVPHGGQNPFEPALLDCTILYGPHMDNFKEFCHELEVVHGAVLVKNEKVLAARVDE
jgi:3-deoxy-D-manno-octulosonic-acid transferase